MSSLFWVVIFSDHPAKASVPMTLGKTKAAVLAVVMMLAAAASAEEMKNLQVFPKDTEKGAVIDVMKKWTGALGVNCTHCHVLTVPGDYDSFDFASDEKPEKKTTRGMMRMVQQLNGGMLANATGEADAKVSCVTCHRGLPNPATLDQVMLKTVQKKGADEAVARYHKLHDRYYGRGSYDFGPDSLMPAIEKLAQGDDADLDAALALAQLAAEEHPDNAGNQVLVAHLLLKKGDKSGATAAVDKALELDPQNRRALRLKQQLGQ